MQTSQSTTGREMVDFRLYRMYRFLGFIVDLLNCLGLVYLIVKRCRTGL